MWYICKMKYFLATKRNEVQIHTVASMNPEVKGVKQRKQITSICMEGPEYGGSFWGDENILELCSDDGCTPT